MTEHTTAVSIKALTDTTATVAGYGVVFGGRDLVGETFNADTDFALDLVPSKPVLYDHAQGNVKHFIGRVTNVSPDKTGLWIEAELSRNTEYVAQVLTLIEKGALGWSSGTAGHMARREGGIIKSWPVIEWSLTPTPAEPRTLGVEMIKSLIESDASFEALLPKGDAATSPAGASDDGDNAVHNVEQGEMPRENDMPEEVKAVAEAPAQDYGAVMSELKSLRDMLEKEPPVNAPNLALSGALKGDSSIKAMAFWMRTGDEGALKASNAAAMSEGTAGAGGYAVPTTMLNQIIARRDEMALAAKLGVRRIPGKGLTVNVPLDGEADGEFITKAEAAAYDLDSPALGQAAMTLVKYTKQIKLSEELLSDEDAALESFLVDFVARGMAKTQNQLLLAEVASGGTALKTFAGATAIAIGEVEDIVSNSDLAFYLDDSASVGYVMLPTTYWAISKLASANIRYYAESNASGSVQNKMLLGYPVYFSAKAGAMTAGQKSVYFGNWNYVGMREGDGLQLLRDPYSNAANGQVNLWYRFRTVFKTLQAEAIGYAAQA